MYQRSGYQGGSRPSYYQQQQPRKLDIDREKTCPFLIRLFWKENEQLSLQSFIERKNQQYEDEIQIHTWKDADLREIVDLVKGTIRQSLVHKDTYFKIFTIYQDPRGEWKQKQIGDLHNSKKGSDDHLNLYECRFQIGDNLSIVVDNNNKK